MEEPGAIAMEIDQALVRGECWGRSAWNVIISSFSPNRGIGPNSKRLRATQQRVAASG